MKHSICLVVAGLIVASHGDVFAEQSVPATEAEVHAAVRKTNPNYTGTGKVYKNDKIRIDPLSNQADKFTADAGHLSRFRRKT